MCGARQGRASLSGAQKAQAQAFTCLQATSACLLHFPLAGTRVSSLEQPCCCGGKTCLATFQTRQTCRARCFAVVLLQA